MVLLARLFMASFLLFDDPRVSVAGQVVTVISTSIATAFSDCTCALTVSDHSTDYKASTTSVNVGPPFTVEPTRSAFPATSVSYPNWSTTSEPTQFSLSICPTRIKNPTYTAPFPQPTNYTWGCPPHYLCQPDKKTPDGECNFEVGPPADTYYCAPDQCAPSPPLLPPQFGKASGTTGEAGFFEVSPGYFNLNPHEFGLDYDIFIFPESSGNAKRELSVRIPGKCYDPCNDAMLEAESTGKTADLCYTNAAFTTLVRVCQSCVASFDLPRTSATVLPQFQQFLFYCDRLHNQTALTAIQSSTSILKATILTAKNPKTIATLLSAMTTRMKQTESSETVSVVSDSASVMRVHSPGIVSSAARISMAHQSSMAPTEMATARAKLTGKHRSSILLPTSTPLLINGAPLFSPCWTLGSLLVAARLFLTS